MKYLVTSSIEVNGRSTGKRAIQSLHVRCTNVDKGCEWEGTVETLEKHMATCNLEELPIVKEVDGEQPYTVLCSTHARQRAHGRH